MISLLLTVSAALVSGQPQYDANHALGCYGQIAFLVGSEGDGSNLNALAPEEELSALTEEQVFWTARTEDAERPDLSAEDQRQLAVARSALEAAQLMLSEGARAAQAQVQARLAQYRTDRGMIDQDARSASEANDG